MNTKENKKTLREANKNTLRGLHYYFGFDFQAPHKILYLAGNYTVKKIEKAAAAAGFSADAEIVILTRDNGPRAAWRRDWKAVEIVGGGVNVEFRRERSCPIWPRPFDTFYAKCSFEELRKEAGAETFIFCQEREYIKRPAAEKKADWSERFKLYGIRRAGDGNGASWISRLELIETTSNGKRRVDYGEGGGWYIRYGWRPQDAGEIIDKSGYLLLERRDDLRRRAAALRAKREKAAYMAADNSAEVEELRGMIQERKAEIVQQLQEATTADELQRVEKALARWGGFAYIVHLFEEFERASINKSYRCIKEREDRYNEIKERLEKKAEAAA